MAASCSLGSRDMLSEHPFSVRTSSSPSLDGWTHASHRARGQAVGTGPGGWGAENNTGLLPAGFAPSPSTSTFTSPPFMDFFFVFAFFFSSGNGLDSY